MQQSISNDRLFRLHSCRTVYHICGIILLPILRIIAKYRSEKRRHIECVCMNMSNAYGKWVRENLAGVPVIYDHFHVIKAIKQACGYRDFKYFRLKVFDLPNLKPPRPHAARGRATFPRTAGFCARERRWSGPNHTTFTPPLGSLDVSGRGGRPRPPATAPQRDLRLIAVAGRRGRRPLPTL